MRGSCLLLSMTLVGCGGTAPQPEHGTDAERAPLELSADLRDALVAEMRAIDRAMPDLQAAVQSGELPRAATVADDIAATFILKQQLTREQRHELHHSAPQEFLHMDHAFHDRAGELASAARAGDESAVKKHLAALQGACVECHDRFR